MAKIHTRARRALKIGTHKNIYHILHKGINLPRPKTFGSEEAAHNWAKLHKVEHYTLKKVKRDKRFQIVQEKEVKRN